MFKKVSARQICAVQAITEPSEKFNIKIVLFSYAQQPNLGWFQCDAKWAKIEKLCSIRKIILCKCKVPVVDSRSV